jgi:hypothetical protein
MRSVLAFIAVVLIGSAAPGNSFAQRGMSPPRVTVLSLEPLPRMGSEQRFRAVLRVDNLNTEPLKTRGIDFSLRLAHQGIIDVYLPPMTVEALDQQLITLDLRSEIIASVSQLLAISDGPENTLPYEIIGKVTFERGRIDPQSFSSEGYVPIVTSGDR